MKIAWTEAEIENQLVEDVNNDDELKKVFKLNYNVVGKFRAIINALKKVTFDIVFSFISSVYMNIFISTADDEALILHLADRGLEPWKQAQKSSVTVRIGASTQPTKTISIPQLATVATPGATSDEIKQFVLLSSGTIDENTTADTKGYYTTEIEAESVETGETMNVPAETITDFITEIDGIDIVYNPVAASDGRDIETPEEVQDRLQTGDDVSKVGLPSWFKTETLNFTFVTKADIVPRSHGRGTVGIAFYTTSGQPTNEQINEIEEYFNNEERNPAGAWTVYAFGMEEHVWNATIVITYSNTEPTDEKLNEAIDKYFSNLSRGENIIEDQIKAIIINNISVVKSVTIQSHSGYDVPEYNYPIRGTITWLKEVYAE